MYVGYAAKVVCHLYEPLKGYTKLVCCNELISLNKQLIRYL